MLADTKKKGDIPFYKIGTFGKIADAFITKEKFQEYKNKYPFPKKGDVLLSAIGTIGRAVIYDGKPAYFKDCNIVWLERSGEIILNRFLYYLYTNMDWNNGNTGTLGYLYGKKLAALKIPVPPLEIQQEIVEILDKFDALANGLTCSIPKEIELRQKQYEYYRNQLLSFR